MDPKENIAGHISKLENLSKKTKTIGRTYLRINVN